MKFNGNIMLVDFEETYASIGDHSFKIIVNPSLFVENFTSNFSMYDPKGDNMKIDARKWGKKIKCNFIIDETTPEGVSVISFSINTDKDVVIEEKIYCWIVK